MGAGQDLFGLRQDGSEFPMELGLNPVETEGGSMVLSAIVDVTQRRQTEAEKEQHRRDLERSNADLEEFAYIASHDLKEPLRGIANNARFLMEDYAEKLDEAGIARLSRLGYLSQRMEQLINDLLYFSRLGHPEPETQLTDLNLVIEGIQMMNETMLQESNAAIVLPRALPIIRCNKIRMTEVFRNLIANAVKYNDNTVKRIEVGYQDETRKYDSTVGRVFYVKDDGIGIAEEFHEEIFRIFKRLNTEDDDKKGTGVGLTFVRRIVERDGGRIWLASRPGEGSTFYFTMD
jgi:light-regulated signal transduction histidine kinase (bacteriophytochrome)